MGESNVFDDDCKADNVRLHLEGRRRHHVAEPSVQLEGPLLPIVLAEGQHSAHHPLGIGHNFT